MEQSGNQLGEIARATLTSSVSSTGESTALDYETKKLSGKCTERGCAREALDGFQLCDEHRERKNASKRKSAKRRRARFRRRRRCTECGGKLAPGSSWACAGCLLEHGRLRSRAVDRPVDDHRVELVADATDGYARRRFKGGKRGAPSVDEQDDFECRIIAEAWQRFQEGMAYLKSPEGMKLLPSERKEARFRALGQLATASRAAEEIIERHRYEQKRDARAQEREKERAKEQSKRVKQLAKCAAQIAKSGR